VPHTTPHQQKIDHLVPLVVKNNYQYFMC